MRTETALSCASLCPQYQQQALRGSSVGMYRLSEWMNLPTNHLHLWNISFSNGPSNRGAGLSGFQASPPMLCWYWEKRSCSLAPCDGGSVCSGAFGHLRPESHRGIFPVVLDSWALRGLEMQNLTYEWQALLCPPHPLILTGSPLHSL